MATASLFVGVIKDAELLVIDLLFVDKVLGDYKK